MRRRPLIGSVGLLAAAGLAAGLWLGLRDGTRQQTSKAYLARVSAVCRTQARRLERVPAPSDPAAYGDVISSLRQVVPLLRAQEAAMRSVEAPAALGPRLKRLFSLNERSVTELETALRAAERRNAGGVATGLLRFSGIRDRVHAEALALGIRCDSN